MLKMDGCGLVAGDRVFDTGYGVGSVEMVGPDYVEVCFANGKHRSYNKGLISHPNVMRTLFWHNPVAFCPPKNLTAYHTLWCAVEGLARGLGGK